MNILIFIFNICYCVVLVGREFDVLWENYGKYSSVTKGKKQSKT